MIIYLLKGKCKQLKVVLKKKFKKVNMYLIYTITY